MNLYQKPKGVQSRWISFEGTTTNRAQAGLENDGSKGHPMEPVYAGETKTLLDINGSGSIRRIWITISDRSAQMLRGLKLEMFWDGEDQPAVSAPLGDFFGIGLGRTLAFESALFSNPEGRSFNCFIPMPFRTSARITLTNETDTDLKYLFYDVDILIDEVHGDDVLYFHAGWRRENPNALGEEFVILPKVCGQGRFLGCNLGVITNPIYGTSWWGEGEVKIRLGDDTHPTLCGTGTEDYIGTAWGQGQYVNRTQGCPIADRENRHWSFYRYHLDDPVYFEDACQVAIQTIGGTNVKEIKQYQANGAQTIPISLDRGQTGEFIHLRVPNPERNFDDPEFQDAWSNFWRQDDWSATAYFYLDHPGGCLPPLQPLQERILGLEMKEPAND